MGEHANYKKGRPYLTSVRVPFIIRYPAQVGKNKFIKTAYSSVDFAPTILSLMGVDYTEKFQGIDGSDEILANKKWSTINQVRFMSQWGWGAAVDRH